MIPDGRQHLGVDPGAARTLLIGALDRWGQATAWSRAAQLHLPDVSAASFELDREPELVVDLRSGLSEVCSHLLIEAGRPLFGPSAVDDVRVLRNAGVHAALVIEGPEVRVPKVEAARLGWDPFVGLSSKARARRGRRAAALVREVGQYGGPMFVATPGLLDQWPTAIWLPLVPADGEIARTPFADQRLAVAVIGTYDDRGSGSAPWIEEILAELGRTGAIDFCAHHDVDRADVPGLIDAADVVVDACAGNDYGYVAVAGMAAGRLVLGAVCDPVRDRVRSVTGCDLPVVTIAPDTLAGVVTALAADPGQAARTAAEGPEFVAQVHSGRRAAEVLSQLVDRPSRRLPVLPARAVTHDGRSGSDDQEVGPRPHALYVAWGFPPCRGGGVYRALATANALDRCGFDVTVLTAERETFERFTGADTSLEALVAPDVVVHRIPFDWPIYESEISEWPRARAKNPQAWGAWRRAEDQKDFPEVSYGPWQPRLLAAAEQINRSRPVDLVIGTANPNVDLVVGHHLHELHGVPYVMDYRDAWRLDVFSGEELDLDPRARELEARYVADAAQLWFVNDPIRDWHARAYPDSAEKMFTVMNGFDANLAPLPRGAGPHADTGLRFGYIGTISPKVPIAEFIGGWREARTSDDVLDRSTADLWGYLGFFALEDTSLKSLIAGAGDDDVFFRGRIDKTRVADAYETFDVLLLILGSGLYVTSGKVFEYLATGLPIVSVHDPRNAASTVLDGYPLWFPAEDLSPEAIAAALSAAAKAASAVDPATRAACLAFAERFERRRQLDPRLQQLRQRVQVKS